jgi:hypothetical protein
MRPVLGFTRVTRGGFACTQGAVAPAVGSPAMETVVNWAQVVGAVLALVAVILAARQLSRAEKFQRQARRDLREDNRTDFHLGLVAEIADLVAQLNEYNTLRIAARLRMLPAEHFPVLRAYTGLPTTQDAQRVYMRLQNQASATVPAGVPPTVYPRYYETFRIRFWQEIDEAITALLTRP